MVRDKGIVEQKANGFVYVRVSAGSDCGDCVGCTLAGSQAGTTVMKAVDSIQVQVGDLVEISNSRGNPVLDGLLLLILPIFFFIIAYSIASSYLSTALTVIVSFASAALPVAFVKWTVGRSGFQMKVERVIRACSVDDRHGTWESETGVTTTRENRPEAIRIRDGELPGD